MLYRIGHADFALDKQSRQSLSIDLTKHRASSAVVLSYKKVACQTSLSQRSSEIWQGLACFYFNDKVRDTAQPMMDKLKALGIETVMLTGDPSPQALTIAKSLGMQTAYNGLSPSAKVDHIQQLQAQGAVVLMVGDGINDAPVLAAADVSTSIAGAADLAQVSSDSIILNGQIEAIAKAKHIADKTERIIKQNFRWALGYNFTALIPAVFGYVPPWLAAIGMSLSSLLVVLNALRLKRA